MGLNLKNKGLPVITSDDLFNHLNSWVEARNKDDADGLWKAHQKIEKSIISTFNQLVDKTTSLDSEISNIKRRLSESRDRRSLIEEIKKLQYEAQIIDNYLSWGFGRFSPEKFGQEVNWLWLDLAAATGVGDLMGSFLRQYSRDTPNSSMFFVNIT
jgi:hypothetical protein